MDAAPAPAAVSRRCSDSAPTYPAWRAASQRAAWRSICPDPNLLLGIPRERFPAATPSRGRDACDATARASASNLSIAYREPVKIVRGWRQYLFDDVGRRYLDAYNNVPHVGMRTRASSRRRTRQMALLNTNTRYLTTSSTSMPSG